MLVYQRVVVVPSGLMGTIQQIGNSEGELGTAQLGMRCGSPTIWIFIWISNNASPSPGHKCRGPALANVYHNIYIYTYYPYYINGAPKGLDTLEMMVDIFKIKAD